MKNELNSTCIPYQAQLMRSSISIVLMQPICTQFGLPESTFPQEVATCHNLQNVLGISQILGQAL
jgi:hypothetical protein